MSVLLSDHFRFPHSIKEDKYDNKKTSLAKFKDHSFVPSEGTIVLHSLVAQNHANIRLKITPSPRKITITTAWLPERLHEFIVQQVELIKYVTKVFSGTAEVFKQAMQCIVVDVCIDDSDTKSSSILRHHLIQSMINNPRHYNCRIFIYMTNMDRLPSEILNQIDVYLGYGLDSKEYQPLLNYVLEGGAIPPVLRDLHNVYAGEGQHPTFVHIKKTGESGYII